MTIGVISLGCPKNLVDTEVMLGLLTGAGHHITPDEHAAEAIIVNTCCFIAPAREEATQAVRDALGMKERGSCRLVIIAGCWPQREGARLLEEFPGVDALVAVNDVPRIAEVIEELESRGEHTRGPACRAPTQMAEKRGSLLRVSPPEYLYRGETPRLLATPPWTAYLKIAEGCDHRCAFCVIPQIRGRFRSRTIESLAAEACDLARRGVKELNLIAQDTTCYGRDLYGRPRICDLLRALAAIDGIRWLRLMYCYPTGIDGELISLLRDEPKLCKYVDLPVQHGQRGILRAMRRPASGERYLELVTRLRERVPGIAVRTSILVGFPGETDPDFEALLDFLTAAQFDRAGAFVYSPERGTPAATMPDQVAPEVARERYRRVMGLQQRISLERNRGWVGSEVDVLIEAPAEPPFSWAGRTQRDAPQIDGLVYLSGGKGSKAGDFVRARISAAREYDLDGIIIRPA
jgi:ribosomal protein S12 methylthiotransferase